MHMVLYMIAALQILLYNLQYLVHSFIDIYGQKQPKKKQKKTYTVRCKASLKMGGMFYIVRATLVRGPLSYITC